MNTSKTLTAQQAQAIATALGPWTVRPNADPQMDDGRRAVLGYKGVNPLLTGATLLLQVADGRLHCTGSLLTRVSDATIDLRTSLSYNEQQAGPGTMTLSLDKSPERIAKDLGSRLVEKYLAQFAQGMQTFIKAQAAQAQQQNRAEGLAALVPESQVLHGKHVGDDSHIRCPGGVTLRVRRQSVLAEYFTMSPIQAMLLAGLMGSEGWRAAARV